MGGRRGQIGSNEMVYLAIAIIVLVLVVGGFVFNWGGMKDKLGGLTGGGKTYASFAQECELACKTSNSAFCIEEREFSVGKAKYTSNCALTNIKNVSNKNIIVDSAVLLTSVGSSIRPSCSGDDPGAVCSGVTSTGSSGSSTPAASVSVNSISDKIESVAGCVNVGETVKLNFGESVIRASPMLSPESCKLVNAPVETKASSIVEAWVFKSVDGDTNPAFIINNSELLANMEKNGESSVNLLFVFSLNFNSDKDIIVNELKKRGTTNIFGGILQMYYNSTFAVAGNGTLLGAIYYSVPGNLDESTLSESYVARVSIDKSVLQSNPGKRVYFFDIGGVKYRGSNALPLPLDLIKFWRMDVLRVN